MIVASVRLAFTRPVVFQEYNSFISRYLFLKVLTGNNFESSPNTRYFCYVERMCQLFGGKNMPFTFSTKATEARKLIMYKFFDINTTFCKSNTNPASALIPVTGRSIIPTWITRWIIFP
jgi:hypothetical protein